MGVGTAVPADRTCLPIDDPIALKDAVEAEMPEEEEAEAEQQELAEDYAFLAEGELGNGTIAMATLVCRGWKSSYRRDQPELKQFAAWRQRWSRARARWEASGVRLAPPRTRRPVQEQLAVQQRWRARSKIPLPAPAFVPGAASSSAS